MHCHLPDREQEKSRGCNKKREGSIPDILVFAEIKDAQKFKIGICFIVSKFQNQSYQKMMTKGKLLL